MERESGQKILISREKNERKWKEKTVNIFDLKLSIPSSFVWIG